MSDLQRPEQAPGQPTPGQPVPVHPLPGQPAPGGFLPAQPEAHTGGRLEAPLALLFAGALAIFGAWFVPVIVPVRDAPGLDLLSGMPVINPSTGLGAPAALVAWLGALISLRQQQRRPGLVVISAVAGLVAVAFAIAVFVMFAWTLLPGSSSPMRVTPAGYGCLAGAVTCTVGALLTLARQRHSTEPRLDEPRRWSSLLTPIVALLALVLGFSTMPPSNDGRFSFDVAYFLGGVVVLGIVALGAKSRGVNLAVGLGSIVGGLGAGALVVAGLMLGGQAGSASPAIRALVGILCLVILGLGCLELRPRGARRAS